VKYKDGGEEEILCDGNRGKSLLPDLGRDWVCKGAKKIPRSNPGDFIQLEDIEMVL
jgi:hypothetical protein